MRRALVFCACVAGIMEGFTSVHAQGTSNFFTDKTIRVIVSYPPGGGYDLLARNLARSMPKHIPGQPTMVVQNMPGAGSRLAAGYVYNVAPQDGTVMATVSQYLPLAQLMDNETNFDSGKFQWIGNLGQGGNNVMAAWHETGVKTIDDVKWREMLVGSTGPQTNTEYYPAVLNNLFETKFRLIRGYSGFPQTLLAIERGELEGSSSADWPGWKAIRPYWLQERKVNIILQIGSTREKELPDVPLLNDLARNDEERQILDLITSGVDIGRPFMAGPKVPQDRIRLLRDAFDKLIIDEDFLTTIKKQNLEISPMSGIELQKLVERTTNAPKSIVDKTRAALTITTATKK